MKRGPNKSVLCVSQMSVYIKQAFGSERLRQIAKPDLVIGRDYRPNLVWTLYFAFLKAPPKYNFGLLLFRLTVILSWFAFCFWTGDSFRLDLVTSINYGIWWRRSLGDYYLLPGVFWRAGVAITLRLQLYVHFRNFQSSEQ